MKEKLLTKRLYAQLAIIYLIVCAVAGTAILMLFDEQMGRLANSYTQAARHSFVINDLRQAVTSITPAVANGFESVEIITSDSNGYLRIPNIQAGYKTRSFTRFSVQKISSNSLNETSSKTIVFHYSIAPALLTIFFTCLSLLAGLSILLHQFKKRALEREETQKQRDQIEIEKAISRQVAHDIRSPLAALEVLVEQSEAVSSEQADAVRSATVRIRNIANDLLTQGQHRTESIGLVLDLVPMITRLIAEKKIQFRHRCEIQILTNISLSARGASACINSTELSRVLSNLINNSYEAMERGQIEISVEADSSRVWIRVRDEGKGIPPEFLPHLGVQGASYLKHGGSGLGIFHARKCINSWNGEFEISSAAGVGTTISFSVPRYVYPNRAILLDDDPAMQSVWSLVAKRKGVELFSFTHPPELLQRIEKFPNEIAIFLDSDLGQAADRGEDVAKTLHDLGYYNIFLSTGFDPCSFPNLPWIRGIIGKQPPWM